MTEVKMTNQQQQQPLWEVMYAARHRKSAPTSSALYPVSLPYAPEIEALAQWLVPEEPEPLSSGLPYPEFTDGYALGAHQARQQIRQRLLDEARRAREGQLMPQYRTPES